jgi:hypothetical protein
MEVLAVDPDEGFGEVRTALEDLVEGLERRYAAPSRDAEAVSLVASRRTILRNLGDVIARAEYELVLSITPELLERFEAELAARREEGVTVELLLSPRSAAPDPAVFDYPRVATVARARRGVTTPVAAVADGACSVYTTRSALRNGGDDYGVVFDRSELGMLVLGFLNTVVWPSATTLAANDDDRPFPRRYATVRRCVREVQHHDGPFHVSVRGRDAISGERRAVDGTLIDVSVSPNRQTAALTLDVGGETAVVGGQAAALEDIEAHEIVVDRARSET